MSHPRPTLLLTLGVSVGLGALAACRAPPPLLPERALPAPEAAVLVGAGDIGSCDSTDDEATGALIKALLAERPRARVFTLGDNAYPAGTTEQFERCYLPAWGAFLDRTIPVPGNHDWMTDNAAGYRAAFGLPAQGPLYRAEELGGWRVLVVDTDCDKSDSCTAASPQLRWLAGELDAHRDRCTLVLGHHPRFSSGPHGSSSEHQPLWETLVAGGADLALFGHDHIYERFAPLGADGLPSETGLRSMVVGTGGRSAYGLRAEPAAGSELRLSGQAGVLILTLEPDGYAFTFVTIDGQVADEGRGSCGIAR